MANNYTITETITLPSRGQLYGEGFNPEITIRSMSVLDEMHRLQPSEKQYLNMAQVINDCIVNKQNGFNSYDLCLGDYQYILYKLRTVTYGPEYESWAICPVCGSKIKGEFSLDDLPIKEFSEDIYNYMSFTLPVSNQEIKIRPRTPRILDNIFSKAKDFKNKGKGDTNLDKTLIYSVLSCIETVDGEPLNPAISEQWVKDLPLKDMNIITNYINTLDNSIGIDNSLIYKCDLCLNEFNAPLRIDSEFFRPTIDIGRR